MENHNKLGIVSRGAPALLLLQFLKIVSQTIIPQFELFPEEDILTKEIASWKGIADKLPDGNRATFTKMLNNCYKYPKAINAKGIPFPNEPVIMALLFSQHKLIEWLEMQVSKNQKDPTFEQN